MTILDESVNYMYHDDGGIEFWVLRNGISGSKVVRFLDQDNLPIEYTEQDLEDAIVDSIEAENN